MIGGIPVTSDDDSMGAVELLLSITPATIAPTATKSARVNAVAMSFFLYYYWLISFFDVILTPLFFFIITHFFSIANRKTVDCEPIKIY